MLSAKIRYNQLIENHPNQYLQNLGTHLAKVSIEQNDGVVKEIDNNGHFDLHEYENTNWSNNDINHHKLLDEILSVV